MGQFLQALGISRDDIREVKRIANAAEIEVKTVLFYDESGTLPSETVLGSICRATGIAPMKFMLRMGKFDQTVLTALRENADAIYDIIREKTPDMPRREDLPPMAFQTQRGRLYQGDCLQLMPAMESESVDLIFADPPFNLRKAYESGIDDDLESDEYLNWCQTWTKECARLLKVGGSLFIFNLPKWNAQVQTYLSNYLTFRDWIAIDIKNGLPLQGRLYPSHYSLLYFTKGAKPSTFHPDRLPLEICPNCRDELKDYGGYKNKMNPLGVNLTDVWYDIPPVRHSKYKKRAGVNELSIRLLDRIIEMASNENDLVFDPFGGSGTTYVVSEIKNRNWIGIELGSTEGIIERFGQISVEAEFLAKIRQNYNQLFSAETLRIRESKGMWTPDSVRKLESGNGDTDSYPLFSQLVE